VVLEWGGGFVKQLPAVICRLFPDYVQERDVNQTRKLPEVNPEQVQQKGVKQIRKFPEVIRLLPELVQIQALRLKVRLARLASN
jgi:hypothetical protein